jgi:uracil-DNA glycosylase
MTAELHAFFRKRVLQPDLKEVKKIRKMTEKNSNDDDTDGDSQENQPYRNGQTLAVEPPPEEPLLSLEFSTIHPSWFIELKEEFQKAYFKKLKHFLANEQSKGFPVFPPEHLIYSWTHLCPLNAVKVVILGQDPYHHLGQAMGLSFSVPKDVSPPPSLLNIFKELIQDPKIPQFKSAPTYGDLSGWAHQGVLLLNTSLTVRAHQAASHANQGWEVSIAKSVYFYVCVPCLLFLDFYG